MKRLLISALFFPMYLSIAVGVIKPIPIEEHLHARDQYERFVMAIILTESRGNIYAMSNKHAVGKFQITPVLLKDYNNRTKSHYLMYNVIDPNVSREVFDYYSQGKTFEQTARQWYGGPSGMRMKCTFDYWIRIIINL